MPPPQAFKLTVSGNVPANIMGAAVLESLGGTVVAVAVKGTGGVFEFYAPDFTIPTMPMPSNTLWAGGGSYPLVLSTMTGDQHLYTAGKGLPAGMAEKFDFTGSTGSANWSDFTQIP
jgi:hypothetical protein